MPRKFIFMPRKFIFMPKKFIFMPRKKLPGVEIGMTLPFNKIKKVCHHCDTPSIFFGDFGDYSPLFLNTNQGMMPFHFLWG